MISGKNTEMILEDGYYVWKKGSEELLGYFFKAGEFDCRCNYPECITQRISAELVGKLEVVRLELGFPLIVTSGFRCKAHQEHLRGTLPPGHTAAGTSTHELGDAVDIRPLRSAHMPSLLVELTKHFHAIGTARSFYHVDLRADKTRRWKYS